jgi:acetyltransferase-like isoleucine patch superfamily enzyme
LAFQILASTFPKVLRGLLLKARLGACDGVPLVGRGVRVTSPQLIRAGRGFVIEDLAEVQGLSQGGVHFGHNVTIGRGAQIRMSGYYGRDLGVGLTVGDESNVSLQAFIGASGGVTIGRRVLMGPGVMLLSEEHLAQRLDIDIKAQGVRPAPIHVEDGVWLGARVAILGGVRVGEGAIVGAGAVVREDVPRYTVAAGVPAKVVRNRSRTDMPMPGPAQPMR